MPNPARPPRLLVLRPYLSHAGRDDAYAHVDALVDALAELWAHHAIPQRQTA